MQTNTTNLNIPNNQSSELITTLSIDNLIFGLDNGQLKLLLTRQTDPLHEGKWALPGGWIRHNENLLDAAHRILESFTGVKHIYLEQLKAFGRVNRVPSNRVVTVAFYALVSADDYSLVAGINTEDVCWVPINELPELVFDHSEIAEHGLEVLRHQVRHHPIGFNLLPEKFTLLQLQALYEAILNTKLDKPNFRRKITKMELLTPCNEKQQGVPHRAANLYRFDPAVYENLTETGFSFEV